MDSRGRWRTAKQMSITGCCLLLLVSPLALAAHPSGLLGPSEQPEAYFNGSSYVRLSRPFSLKQIVGLSFRTCVGGEVFSQRWEGQTLHVTALFEHVSVTWSDASGEGEVSLPSHTLDNRWHWVALRPSSNPPALLLQVDEASTVVANVTWHASLLASGSANESPDAQAPIVGNVFSGCIREGPQLEFHPDKILARHVLFGPCPLTTDACKDRKDVLRSPPKDYCFNEPCLRHGTCISRHDRYECHCSARFGGNNCELELGPPCASQPCKHGGRCTEDERGDINCHCTDHYQGRFCEIAIEAEAQCASLPCKNNGTCLIDDSNEDTYTCACQPGFTGRNCETDIDECSEHECQNGGKCVDGMNGYSCDCNGTGYGGAYCSVNINECQSSPCVHGVCYDLYAGFVCACLPGFTGEHCEREAGCAASPCGAGGACVEGAGGAFRCVCARGYEPPLCDKQEPCALHDCPPHSHCTSQRNKQPLCICDNGYYGASGTSPNCSRLESACESGVCQNGATCSTGPDYVNCTCAPGFKGSYCEWGAAKALAEKERCSSMPCLHAKTCLDTSSGFRCECEPGWWGARCDSSEGDCSIHPCAENNECVEGPLGWRCKATPCLPSPCNNNGTCQERDGTIHCYCPTGFTGRLCEVDVDECSLNPKICNHGVCVNLPGTFQCYCKPGYTGDNCELDIDECLSKPCKNGGSCVDLENNYECTCPPGFQGKDCSVEIDECQSSPCAVGSTCIDRVNAFECVCSEGLTGQRCEIDIDDCESTPCENGGVCSDLVGGYSCSCSGTGFTGERCHVAVDECESQPCLRQAECVDLRDDYRCVCPSGYEGKNCQTDVDDCSPDPCLHGGLCLQRSDESLYGGSEESRVGPQPWMVLPASFAKNFSYSIADGFVCVCPPGAEGLSCEVDVDECASAPCRHGGQCSDRLGGYSCECAQGFEGINCETEIDECERFAPCENGRCLDLRGDFQCVCAAGWGGRTCAERLRGCESSPCLNGGTCKPWLDEQSQHRFNCSCAPGHAGSTCQLLTTMSLERSSFVEINTTREEGYDLSFRFKTTLGNALLAMGRGLTYFFLELSNGRLNLHSSLLNKWEGVFIGSNLNDSNWQKVFVTINSSHVVLSANEEQTIYPISQNEASNSSVTSFVSTRLGTAGSSYAGLTHGANFFIGCLQDLVVNGHVVALGESETDALLSSVGEGCPRVEQCLPQPCHSGGSCEDRWTSFRCTCLRPYYGDTCQFNHTAATFGHESVNGTSVGVWAHDWSRRLFRAAVDVSMFIRTRKPTGHIFYLGSGPKMGSSDETMVGGSLSGGELVVHLRFNHTPEEYTVGGTRLDNGYMHLIQVVRNSTLVQVKLNGTEYFRKSISAARPLDATVLYLGGPPPSANDSTPDNYFFKGVIQDVQISNGVNVSLVQLFGSEPGVMSSFGSVVLPNAVLEGVRTDDACASAPCLHDAKCTVTWNDYVCTCPRGYKGKQCAEVEFCQLEGCPTNSQCRNLDTGYECLSNATFIGANTTLTYKLRVPRGKVTPPDSITITYRTKFGGTLLHASLGEEFLSIGEFREQISLAWRLNGALPLVKRIRRSGADTSQWNTVKFVFNDGLINGWFVEGDGSMPMDGSSLSAGIDVEALQNVLTNGQIVLGGLSLQSNISTTTTTAHIPTTMSDMSTESSIWEYTDNGEWPGDNVGDYFKGCMGEVHIGSLLLPFFTEEQLFVGAAASLLASQPHYALLSGVGFGWGWGVSCVLCVEGWCGLGRCKDVRNSFQCECPQGSTGEYCEIDIDECVDNKCENGAKCIDKLAHYECECTPGYEGQFCEKVVDVCASNPCGGHGVCSSNAAAFTCRCLNGWRGSQCQIQPPHNCEDQPCLRGICTDNKDASLGVNYTCECPESFVGVHCEIPFCEETPCEHGKCVVNHKSAECVCASGWQGKLCSEMKEVCVKGVCGSGICQPTPTMDPPYKCICDGTGFRGANCSVDIDECAEGLVSCGPGVCNNSQGGYICECAAGFCGDECALADPCYVGSSNGSGPCENGECKQKCRKEVDYECICVEGWTGGNCSLAMGQSGGVGGVGGVVMGVGAGVVLLLLAVGVIVVTSSARRKRATRGTYSPSGQEYCNPRAEMMHNALKPPPEERLI